MAVRDDRGGNDRTKLKFRFVEVELEGGNAALQETVRSVGQLLKNGSSPAQIVRALPKMANGNGAHATVNDKTNASEETDLDMASEIEGGEPEAEQIQSSAPKAPRKPAKPSVPDLIDIDFKAGKETFQDFAATKKPKTDQHKVLVLAGWLKLSKTDPITVISGGHIRSGFKCMDWPALKDFTGPFRSMKSQGLFTSGPEKGTYILKGAGEIELDKLPKD